MKKIKLCFLDIYFLDLARAAAATVGKVIRYNSMQGNGFMISDKLFLTNNHIIQGVEEARRSIVEFDYELDLKQNPKTTTKFKLAADKFFMSSSEEDLDFTIIATGDRILGKKKLSDFGFCPIKETKNTHSLGEFINIVQYPRNYFKKIAIRNNRLVAQTDEVLHYYANVISGSSGSPVFNDKFEVIGLHHYGKPGRIAYTQNGKPGPENVKEGIRISAIVKRIKKEKKKLPKNQRDLIETALNYPFSCPSLVN